MHKEWLTDIEKRILFSALSREKEVCIQVDAEFNENVLTPVCNSLKNKFYYDRLFKQMEKEITSDVLSEFVKKLCVTLEEYQTGFNMVSMANVYHFADKISKEILEK